MKIGEYLYYQELLSLEQCEEILKIQKGNMNKKFGEIAAELGYITQTDLEYYIIQESK